MNDITIRNLDHASVQRLRQLAWLDGRPLEELVRDLLLAAPELRLVASKLRLVAPNPAFDAGEGGSAEARPQEGLAEGCDDGLAGFDYAEAHSFPFPQKKGRE